MKPLRERNSQKSREDILNAAEIEFAEKGIYGTRVDEIASKANINKRMIYEYFGSKEELYKAVLVNVYSRLGSQEILLLSEETSAVDAVKKLIELYFTFLKENPTFVNLLQWENLNKGKYIQDADFTGIKDPTLELLRNVIYRGMTEGVFKTDIDTEQVILSLLTYCFSYFANRYTLSKLMATKLDDEENVSKRVQHVMDMFLTYLCK